MDYKDLSLRKGYNNRDSERTSGLLYTRRNSA